MLLIISICGVFINFFIADSRAYVQRLLDTEVSMIRAVIAIVEKDNDKQYRRRIETFVSFGKLPKHENMISAFASRDREQLLQLSLPYLDIFKKENPYFSTLSWLTPDNHSFLRVHRPGKFGDEVGKMRPDVVGANKKKLQYAGYMVSKTGLQYRLVQPVFFKGRHIGVVQFGIENTQLLDTITENLHLSVGIAIPNTKASVIKHDRFASLKYGNHTIQAQDIGLYQDNDAEIDWNLNRQEVIIQGKPYLIVKVLDLLDYEQQRQGYVFVTKDLTEQRYHLQERIILLFSLAAFVVLCSFLLLYFSYNALIQKIIDLNRSLKNHNQTLENRVQERTSELRDSQKQLQKILDKSPLGILIIELKNMQLRYVNPAVCNLLGYDKKTLETMDINSLHKPEDLHDIHKEFNSQAEEEKHLAVDIPFLKKNGSLVKSDVSSAPIVFDGEACLVGFVIDQTERKNLEIQLHRSQKMEAIGLMAGGVAHDLNNILSGIVSYPELLLMQLPENSELKGPIKAIRESGERAATVVADLLTVARGAAMIRAPHDIHVLINEYLHSPECEQRQSLYPDMACIANLEAEDCIVSCSPVHVKKVVMNLVNNGMEAITGKGTIFISTRNQQLDTQEALKLDLQAGDYLMLSVKDDGAGIAEEDLEHIFEPFYTRKVMGKSGTGLGLAIVWNSMQDHNGKVTVESSDQGTCFNLYFPIDTKNIGEEEKINFTETFVDTTNKHILVVDDEPQLRDIASQMLLSMGCRVDCVSSGEEAVAFVKENPVDLVVLDMLMDPGMNGYQTFKKILEIYPEQKAIIVSGFSESDDVKATLLLGAGGFIHKPYSLAQFRRVIGEVLRP